jgi:hypothetical protein
VWKWKIETGQKGEKMKQLPPPKVYFSSVSFLLVLFLFSFFSDCCRCFFGGGELCGADDLFVPRWGGALRERASPFIVHSFT